MINHQESCEVDVWPELQKVTMDIISWAAFGSNYEEGKRLFELQKELFFFFFWFWKLCRPCTFPVSDLLRQKKSKEKEINKDITSMIRDLIQRKEYVRDENWTIR